MTSLVPLKRVVDPSRPITYGIVQAGSDVDGGVPYIRPVDMSDHGGIADPSELRTTSREIAAQYQRSSVQPGDIVVSIGSSYGKTMVVPAELDGANLTQGTARVAAARDIDARYLRWTLRSKLAMAHWDAAVGGATFRALNLGPLADTPIPLRPLGEQQSIADYLDAETARVDALIAKKQQLIHLLEERIDAAIMEVVGRSEIVATGREPSVEIRRVLAKLERTTAVDEMITAFRDGQVTTRAARGKEGFTNSWTDNARVQGVQIGDVVVHGLDGFSGAIGDSEADGVCSPVYHVCRPRDGGDPAFYGRLLRRLALTGYLGNFAVSTRERAVDFRNWDLFGRIPIPLVPIAHQREIGSRIRALRPLIDLVEKSEALAAERKAALISQVVAGEFAVPGTA